MSTFLTISYYAFKDLIRQRILYNIFFVSMFLLCFGYLAALLVFGHQDRVMLHFGMMVNALSVFVVASSAGSRVIRQELEQRTAYLPLSRPVSRPSYFFGKWFGIVIFSALNLFLLTLVLMYGLHLTGGVITLAFFQAVILNWVEAMFICALALTLSLFLRQGLTTMVCIAYLFVSHNHEQLDFLRQQNNGPGGLLAMIRYLTPDAQALLLDTRVFYRLNLTGPEFFERVSYGFLWALFFLLIGNACFYRKNL